MNEVTLRLTLDDLAAIDRALQDAPFRIAAPLIDKINAQLMAQQEKRAQDETGR
jgi:hypothetical protein